MLLGTKESIQNKKADRIVEGLSRIVAVCEIRPGCPFYRCQATENIKILFEQLDPGALFLVRIIIDPQPRKAVSRTSGRGEIS
jgi:hypothetical protein